MKVRSNFISNLLVVLCAVFALLFFTPKAVPRDTQGESVYGVLDQLGPVVFNGNISGIGSLTVFWQNDNLTILKDGLPVVDQVVTNLEDGQVFLTGVVLYPSDAPKDVVKTVQATFSLNDKGDLEVVMADWEGFDGFGVTISKIGEPTLGETCVCYGLPKKNITKRKCTIPECADAGVNCNTNPNGPAVTCQNHAASVNELSPSK